MLQMTCVDGECLEDLEYLSQRNIENGGEGWVSVTEFSEFCQRSNGWGHNHLSRLLAFGEVEHSRSRTYRPCRGQLSAPTSTKVEEPEEDILLFLQRELVINKPGRSGFHYFGEVGKYVRVREAALNWLIERLANLQDKGEEPKPCQ